MQIFEKVLGGVQMTCRGYWSSWSGEIVDQKRKEIRVRFSFEACEKYVIGFLHGGMNFCGQIFLPHPTVGSRFCENRTILCIGFSHGAVKFI